MRERDAEFTNPEGDRTTPTDTPENVEAFIDSIGGGTFESWYADRQYSQNVEEGKPYFNGPSPPPPSARHSPSSLLQCHRKRYYRDQNAPAEQPLPEGRFWVGTKLEEDLVLPFLRDHAPTDRYVRNSMWIDFEVDTGIGPLRFKGVTDPVLVDEESRPVLPTEIKTKESLKHLTEPNEHHVAQLHAYMRGLEKESDDSIREGVLLYLDREQFDVRVFAVSFDESFWTETVLPWAARLTQYRKDDKLPPAEPGFDWECNYCSYRHRCGQADTPYEDYGPRGFLTGFAGYPRGRVEEYFRAHADSSPQLTPALAFQFPTLAERFAVQEWECKNCGTRFDWDEVEATADPSRNPLCPNCASEGSLSELRLKGREMGSN